MTDPPSASLILSKDSPHRWLATSMRGITVEFVLNSCLLTVLGLYEFAETMGSYNSYHHSFLT